MIYEKSRTLIKVLLLCNYFLLAGCSVYSIEASKKARAELRQNHDSLLDKAISCCDDFSEINYTKLVPGKKIKYQHNTSIQAKQFEFGKSFIKGFELPTTQEEAVLFIESRLVGHGLVSNSLIAYPSILILDVNFQVLGALEKIPYIFTSPFTSKDGMEATFKLGSAFTGAKYLVIYVNPLIQGTLSYCRGGNGYVLSGGGSPVYVPGNDLCFNVPFTIVGKIGVEVNPT